MGLFTLLSCRSSRNAASRQYCTQQQHQQQQQQGSGGSACVDLLSQSFSAGCCWPLTLTRTRSHWQQVPGGGPCKRVHPSPPGSSCTAHQSTVRQVLTQGVYLSVCGVRWGGVRARAVGISSLTISMAENHSHSRPGLLSLFALLLWKAVWGSSLLNYAVRPPPPPLCVVCCVVASANRFLKNPSARNWAWDCSWVWLRALMNPCASFT